MLTLRDAGLAVVRVAPFLRPAAKWLYLVLPDWCHDTPTSWLRKKFKWQYQVNFVQLGAYDGIAGDPIRPLVLQNPDWKGILVEPQKRAFARLRKNYLDVRNELYFVNCAVSDTNGEITFYEIPEPEIDRLRLPDWSREIASAREGHIEKHFDAVRVVKRLVPAMRFGDVAHLHGFYRVDLIVIDVEGYERQIIDDIDLDGLGVRTLIYEHKHMDATDRSAVAERLKSFGFSLRDYGRDTVAHR
jgi:FkbM family methyltransferase